MSKSLLSNGVGEFAILPQFCPIFNIGGDEPRPRLFQVSKLSEDQKKKTGLHQKWKPFFPRIEEETCAQMHTRVKLWEGMQIKTILKLLGGGYNQIIGGNTPPPPPPPGFGTPKSNYADQIQRLYSAVVRSVTTPLACQTKCRIKKIARFSSFKTVFCIGIDSKMI